MSNNKPICLFIEDEPIAAKTMRNLVRERGFKGVEYMNGKTFFSKLPDFEFHGALVDLKLGDGPSGHAVLRWLGENHPSVPVSILSGFLRADSVSSTENMAALSTVTETFKIKWRFFIKGLTDPQSYEHAMDFIENNIP